MLCSESLLKRHGSIPRIAPFELCATKKNNDTASQKITTVPYIVFLAWRSQARPLSMPSLFITHVRHAPLLQNLSDHLTVYAS